MRLPRPSPGPWSRDIDKCATQTGQREERRRCPVARPSSPTAPFGPVTAPLFLAPSVRELTSPRARRGERPHPGIPAAARPRPRRHHLSLQGQTPVGALAPRPCQAFLPPVPVCCGPAGPARRPVSRCDASYGIRYFLHLLPRPAHKRMNMLHCCPKPSPERSSAGLVLVKKPRERRREPSFRGKSSSLVTAKGLYMYPEIYDL